MTKILKSKGGVILRRKRALERLEAQLKKHDETLKKQSLENKEVDKRNEQLVKLSGNSHNMPKLEPHVSLIGVLEEKNIERIKKEIETLKSRIL